MKNDLMLRSLGVGEDLPEYEEISFTGTYIYESISRGADYKIESINPSVHTIYDSKISITSFITNDRASWTDTDFIISGYTFTPFENWMVVEVSYTDETINYGGLLINDPTGAKDVVCGLLSKDSSFNNTMVSCNIRFYNKKSAPKTTLTIVNDGVNPQTIHFDNEFIGQDQLYQEITIPGNSSVKIPTYIGVPIHEYMAFIDRDASTGIGYSPACGIFINDFNPVYVLPSY